MTVPPRFFCDVHVSLETVRQLRSKGVDIVHSGDVGLADTDDETLLLDAKEQQRVMVSCDDDFVRAHDRWQQAQREHAGIVYFRMSDQCKSISIVVRELLFCTRLPITLLICTISYGGYANEPDNYSDHLYRA